MTAVQLPGNHKTARLRDAVAGDVLMREEAARLKQERAIADSLTLVLEAEQREVCEVAA